MNKPEVQLPNGAASAASEWEVFAVRYGTRTASRSSVFLHYEVYGEADAPVEMDYFFWLIRCGDDCVLVDTGFSNEGGARRGRTMLIHPIQALSLFGLRPEDVRLIVITHAHYDHIGNLAAFPSAQVVIARREFDFWTGPLGNRPVFMSSAESDEIELLRTLQAKGSLTMVEGQTQLRPGIRLIEVGGHTPGQLIVTVDTAGGRVVLTSDAVHYYEEVDRDRPFAHVVDVEAMYDAFATLRSMTERPDHVLVAGHDPLVMSKFEDCSGELHGRAVRVG